MYIDFSLLLLEIFLFSLFIFLLSNFFHLPSPVCVFSPRLLTGQIFFFSVSFAKVRTWEETSWCTFSRAQLAVIHQTVSHGTSLAERLQGRFFTIIIKVSYSSLGFRGTLENVIQTLLRIWFSYSFFFAATQIWFYLWGNQQLIPFLQEQPWD